MRRVHSLLSSYRAYSATLRGSTRLNVIPASRSLNLTSTLRQRPTGQQELHSRI